MVFNEISLAFGSVIGSQPDHRLSVSKEPPSQNECQHPFENARNENPEEQQNLTTEISSEERLSRTGPTDPRQASCQRM